MNTQRYSFDYEVYESSTTLDIDDQELLRKAQEAADGAYAVYSGFNVGAAAQLLNGEVVTGSNQENASYPAGICAEGTTLAVASARFPGMPIKKMAISFKTKMKSDHAIAPCGICRQQLQEFSIRTGSPIRLIMGGLSGEVIVVQDASSLLPFAFKF